MATRCVEDSAGSVRCIKYVFGKRTTYPRDTRESTKSFLRKRRWSYRGRRWPKCLFHRRGRTRPSSAFTKKLTKHLLLFSSKEPAIGLGAGQSPRQTQAFALRLFYVNLAVLDELGYSPQSARQGISVSPAVKTLRAYQRESSLPYCRNRQRVLTV